MGNTVARTLGFTRLAPPPGAARAQALSAEDARRIAPYEPFSRLLNLPPSEAPRVRDRLTSAIRQAHGEFGGRGPPVAQYFLR